MSQAKVAGSPVSGFSNSGGTPGPDLVMTCTLPSGIQVGEKLLLGLSIHSGSPPSAPSGWTAIGLMLSANVIVALFERVADGSESSSVDVTLHVSTPKVATYVAFRITDHDPSATFEFSTRAQGQNTAPNPPALSPSWGNLNTLFMTFFGWRWGAATLRPVVSNYSTGYDDSQVSAVCDVANSVGVAAAFRNDASPQNPDPATLSQIGSWAAYTIGIKSAS